MRGIGTFFALLSVILLVIAAEASAAGRCQCTCRVGEKLTDVYLYTKPDDAETCGVLNKNYCRVRSPATKLHREGLLEGCVQVPMFDPTGETRAQPHPADLAPNF